MTNIVIVGASGRMGRFLIQAVTQAGYTLSGAIERVGSPAIGQDAGAQAGINHLGVTIGDDLSVVIANSNIIIDFSSPAATLSHLRIVQQAGKAMVIGTTGFSSQEIDTIHQIATDTPVVLAANYSVGVNVSLGLLKLAAQILGSTTDIEIIEAHHKHKVDAPSGTALMMGQAVCQGLDVRLDDVAVYTREGQTGPRGKGDIGFQTIRGGDIVGEHTVMFIGEGERLEIKHSATSRMNFATGAVRAAHWVHQKSAGLYNMQDVLGLN